MPRCDVIVSGASGGIGSYVAQSLLDSGYHVICGYRSRPISIHGALSVQADLIEPTDRNKLLDAASDLYAVVILAGDAARPRQGESTEDQYRRSYDANFIGPILLAREAAARMDAGAIVLLSTMQATGIFPNSTAYAAPKAALIQAARILAKERRNLRVNVIAPGVIEAGMALPSIQSGKYRRYIEEGLIPRYGQPSDIARAVRILLEPDNYMTGQVLTVDGGLTL